MYKSDTSEDAALSNKELPTMCFISISSLCAHHKMLAQSRNKIVTSDMFSSRGHPSKGDTHNRKKETDYEGTSDTSTGGE